MTFSSVHSSLDSRTRQLLRDGAEVGLSPKAFQLLLLLVEHRSRAMSRDELQQQLWPSTLRARDESRGSGCQCGGRSGTARNTRPSCGPCIDSDTGFIGDVDETDASSAPGTP